MKSEFRERYSVDDPLIETKDDIIKVVNVIKRNITNTIAPAINANVNNHSTVAVVIIIRQLFLCSLAILTIYLIQWIVWSAIMQHEISSNECRVKHSYFHNGTEVAMFAAIKILNEINVDWMIGDGTLLGFARNQKTIPWDNDADLHLISLNRTEEELFHAIEQKFTNALPFSHCHLVVRGLLHCGQTMPNADDHEKLGYVDMFYLSVDNETNTISTFHSGVDYLNGLHISYVLPLRKRFWSAYDMQIPVAHKYEQLLAKQYGSNYATPRCAIKTCTHNYEDGRMSTFRVETYFDLYVRWSILVCTFVFGALCLLFMKYTWIMQKWMIHMDKHIHRALSKLRLL